MLPLKKETPSKINLKINPNRRFLKAILLLFIEPFTAGTRDSEKYIFPHLAKVKVTIKGSPNKIFTHFSVVSISPMCPFCPHRAGGP